MHKDQLVTVCITTYNRKSLLPRAVESVLNQTYANFELIIVDDFSNDGTDVLVQSLLEQDKRVRYIRHEVNKGLAAARNTAIFNSKGIYFTFVDDDDRWTENYLAEFIKIAEYYGDDWCFCCGSITQDLLGQTVYANYESLEGPLIDYVQLGYTPPIASQFYVTSTLKRCGGYNEKVKNGVDHDLWLTLAFSGVKIKSVDEYLSLPSEVIDVSRAKMTNSYQKRISGITNSLSIWKANLVSHFGELYYRSFADAYLVREKKKFFRMYILRFAFGKALKIYRDLEGEVSPREVAKSIFIAILIKTSLPIRRKKYIRRGSSLKINVPSVMA